MATQPPPAHPLVMEAKLEHSSLPADSPLPEPVFTTNRLLVRHMHPSDNHSMSASANSPLVAKFMSLAFPSPYTLESAETWIKMNLVKPQQDAYCICEKSSPDIVIGGIGHKLGADINSHTAEVGYWIGEKYWGKGYTTECLEAFTKWSFLEFARDNGTRLTRLWGGVLTGNGASMRCFEKCGYLPEGVLKGHCEKHGQTYDA
jgi:[ribosomal protein S5]-alanine N-acetyltransferase